METPLTMINNNPDIVQTAKDKVVDIVKTYVFDLIALAVIVSSFLLSLGALDLIDLTKENITDIIVGFIPYYFASVLLQNNFYLKGSFKGKTANKYINAITIYSKQVNDLTGRHLDALPDFCDYYNEQALMKIQAAILKKAAISYEEFDVGMCGNKPLKIMSNTFIKHHYTTEQARRIIMAKRATVKGLTDTMLLSNIKTIDDTDIGKSEEDLAKSNTIRSIVMSALSMFLLCLIGIKDISDWGWFAAFLVVFKLVWILCTSYTKYFKGYNNITIDYTSHILRKYDILKQFIYWFDNTYIVNDKTEYVEPVIEYIETATNCTTIS